MRHLAIDLETLSTDPSGVILTVGLAFFSDESDDLKSSQVTLPVQPQLDLGRTVEARTLGWWLSQDGAARESIAGAFNADGQASTGRARLTEGLRGITHLFGLFNPERVWGNGSDFDNAMLASLFTTVGIELPWKFWQNRDMRTLMEQFPEYERVRPDVSHNAQHDAIAQARTIRRILSKGQF